MVEQGPDFWCWFDTTQFSYYCVHPILANMFSIQNVITFQLNCAEGLHFSAFHIISTHSAYQNDHQPSLIRMVILKVKDSLM